MYCIVIPLYTSLLLSLFLPDQIIADRDYLSWRACTVPLPSMLPLRFISTGRRRRRTLERRKSHRQLALRPNRSLSLSLSGGGVPRLIVVMRAAPVSGLGIGLAARYSQCRFHSLSPKRRTRRCRQTPSQAVEGDGVCASATAEKPKTPTTHNHRMLCCMCLPSASKFVCPSTCGHVRGLLQPPTRGRSAAIFISSISARRNHSCIHSRFGALAPCRRHRYCR